MLGGLGYLDETDISKSGEFLMHNIKDVAPSDIALDVGAGVGRISSKLLSKMFRHILLSTRMNASWRSAGKDWEAFARTPLHAGCRNLHPIELGASNFDSCGYNGC